MFQYEIRPLLRQQLIQTMTDNIAAPFSNHKLQEDGASLALKKSVNNTRTLCYCDDMTS